MYIYIHGEVCLVRVDQIPFEPCTGESLGILDTCNPNKSDNWLLNRAWGPIRARPTMAGPMMARPIKDQQSPGGPIDAWSIRVQPAH